jgi:hypothetical protein
MPHFRWTAAVGYVAKRKVDQYVENAFNILVVINDSNSLQLMAQSAVNEYDDELSDKPQRKSLRKLNGILLVNTGWVSCVVRPSNVEFALTSNPLLVMPEELSAALGDICLG